jgi:hypothetical protein
MISTARSRRRRGQGMTEYIIIVGVIAILLITAIGLYRESTADAYGAGVSSVDANITSPITGWYSASGTDYRWNEETRNWHDPTNDRMVSDATVAADGVDPRMFER